MGIAQGWRSSLLECEAGGGTLLSLGREGVENAVAEAIGLSDFWTGRILNSSWILVPSQFLVPSSWILVPSQFLVPSSWILVPNQFLVPNSYWIC